MKWLVLICTLATGCSNVPGSMGNNIGEPDGTSQMMKIADIPPPGQPGVYVVRDYEHGQLCTIARGWEGVSISCQAWELPPP